MRRITAICVVLVLLLADIGFGVANIVHAEDLTSASYQILGPVMSAGGYGTSSSYTLFSSISEFAHDIASGASLFTFNPGFVAYPFVSTPVVSATGVNASASLSWTSATGVLGYSVSGYSVGQSSISGGPYTFTSVGNVLAYSASGLTNGSTYYFVLRVLDPQGITIATSSEVSATPAASSPSPPAASGGGGGGATVTQSLTPSGATANFSGRAYPNSTVVLLKDGQIALSTLAGGDARFQFSLANLSAGSYVFLVYGIDSAGNKSIPLSFPETLIQGATTNIGGVFISPTIDTDKSQVRKGENIMLFGRSAASSTITISVHSNPEFFVTTASDTDGAYLYALDTAPLDFGNHLAKSKAALAGQISNFSASVGFAVGLKTVVKKEQQKNIHDINNDNRVNLTDFSIMVYWFRRPLAGVESKVDLNHDGKVDLVDFSIMAAHWTG